MKKVLITGGAGFIGSALTLKLIKKGYSIKIMDNLSKQIHGDNPENSELFNKIKDKVEFIYGDVKNYSDWEKALQDSEAVIHLAAETGTGQSMYEIKKYSDVNISGTSILLDILTNKKSCIEKVIIASSRAIYGEGRYQCSVHNEVFPLGREDADMRNGDFSVKCPICKKKVALLSTTEDSKIHPTSIYGITKQAQEELTILACKSTGIPAVSLRYQNVYGPGQSLTNPYTGILSIFSVSLLTGIDLNIFEDGKESRDFIYIDDVIEGTILSLESNNANFKCINIGTGVPTDVITVANQLKKAYNSSSKINITGNYRLGDIRHNFADITLAKKVLGFEPTVSFDKGIVEFTNWVKQQKIDNTKNLYNTSLNEMKNKGLFK